MGNDRSDNRDEPLTFPREVASELRGKQSVRATFRLTQDAIGMLNVVAVHMGIKQKSLFDHLMENVDSLQRLADDIEKHEFRQRRRVQKTFVLSRKTLSSLDKACRDSNTPRDAIVEYSIHRLMPIIAREKEKHQRRKKMIDEIAAYVAAGRALLDSARESLGEDDPVFDRLEKSVLFLQNAYEHIASYVERGDVIESFESAPE